MDRLKSQIAIAASFVVLGLIGMVMSANQAGAQGGKEPGTAPVSIVSPLPLPVTGSISGTVATTQSGEWNVGVQGVVSVKNVDERGRNPYFVEVPCFTDNGVCDAIPRIPVGKRLVLEHISAFYSVGNADAVHRLFVVLNGRLGAVVNAHVSSTHEFTSIFTINEPVLMFADSDDSLDLQISASTLDISGSAILSGYLVDISN